MGTRLGRMDVGAVSAGAIRLSSGISFLIAPERANKLWGGDPDDVGPTAHLLLRSMGYRDALIGGGLLRAGLLGDSTAAAWFLASAGADAADLVGGIANHHRMTAAAKRKGIGGAVLGVTAGLAGAARIRRQTRKVLAATAEAA